jgi:hypothetical protein
MEPDIQGSDMGPDSELRKCSPDASILGPILTLSFNVFPSGFSTKTLYAFLFSPMRAKRTIHLIPLDLFSLMIFYGRTRERSWLRHYTVSRKVVGLIPIGFFNWPNPSSHTVALGSTQPPTEMSTRNLPGGKGRPARKADNLTAICEPNVQKMWEPRRLTTDGPPRPVTGTASTLVIFDEDYKLWSST